MINSRIRSNPDTNSFIYLYLTNAKLTFQQFKTTNPKDISDISGNFTEHPYEQIAYILTTFILDLNESNAGCSA